MVVTVPRFLLPITVANLLIMNDSKQITSQLSCLQVQKSLTLCWRSFWELACYCVVFFVGYKGCQYFGYAQLRANCLPIDIHTKPKIIVTPMTPIFSIGLYPCRFVFCQSRQPICVLWITACKSLSNLLTYKTINRWRSIHTHNKHVLTVVLWIIILYK